MNLKNRSRFINTSIPEERSSDVQLATGSRTITSDRTVYSNIIVYSNNRIQSLSLPLELVGISLDRSY